MNATVAMAIDDTSTQELASVKNVTENPSSIKTFLLFISQLAGTISLVVFGLWLVVAIFAKVFFKGKLSVVKPFYAFGLGVALIFLSKML